MNPGLIGGIAGGVIGIAGGLVGTYFSIKNTRGPRERAFVNMKPRIHSAFRIRHFALGLALLSTVNSPSAALGQTGPGTALSFDGVNDYVQVPGFLANAPTTEVTVEFWQKVTATRVQSSFCQSAFVNGSIFNAHVPYSDGKVYWDFGDIYTSGRLSYTPSVSIVGSWQHFALVASQSGNNMLIYRNGVLEAQKTGMTPLVRGNLDLDIGGAASLGVSFLGQIDEFRIWNVARSQAQILTNMNRSLTLPQANLVAYWRFDEGSGNYAHDSSGNGNTGTLLNGPAWVTIPFPPSVTTELPGAVTTNSAVVSLAVNPNGQPASVWFQTGTTTNYGSSTAPYNTSSGTNVLPFQAILTGLTPGTLYHYQAMASNSVGVVEGGDQTFQTALPGATNPPMLNYALAGQAAATQSSTAPNGDASKAIDGIADGLFAHGSVSQTAGGEDPAWWQVDLGSMRTIGSISVAFRTDCSIEQAKNFMLTVEDGTGAAVWQQQYPGVPTSIVSTNMPIPIQGQIVRVQVSGNPGGALGLAEVQVFAPYQYASVTVTQDVQASLTAQVGQIVTFGPIGVSVMGLPPSLLTYQWQSNSTDIAGANLPFLTVMPYSVQASGNTFRCRLIVPGLTVNTGTGTLNVLSNQVAPAVTGVAFSTEGTSDLLARAVLGLDVNFDRPVDPSTATNLANYGFSAGQVVGATLSASRDSVILSILNPAPPGTPYLLWAAGVTASGSATPMAVTNSGAIPFYTVNHARSGVASQSSAAPGCGPEKAIDGRIDGNLINGSIAQNAAPESPGWWEVDLQVAKSIGQVHVWFRTDSCTGLPGATGPARNDDFTLKVLDANRTVLWTNTYAGTPPKDVLYNFSPALQGRYVRFESQTPLTTSDGIFDLVQVQVLAPFTSAFAYESFSVSSTNPAAPTVPVQANHTALLSAADATLVGAPGDQLTYQWQRNGTNIPGATGATYTTPPQAVVNTGDRYQCNLILPGTNTLGTPWTISVVPDQTPPKLLAVTFDENGGGVARVTALFDKLMNPATLRNPSNYQFTGADTIGSPTTNLDGKSTSFLINQASVGNQGFYSLKVSGVSDLTGNLISSNTVIFGVIPFSSTNLALHGTASQSSTAPGAPAQLAIDCNTNGVFFAGSVTSNAPPDEGGWWEVNLGSSQAIGRIHVWFRTDAFTNRQDNFTLKVLDAQRNLVWHQQYPGRPPTDVGTNITPAVVGQFVRFEAPVPEIDDGAFSLAEVQVFAPYTTNRTPPEPTARLAASRQGTNLILSWNGTGVLQNATSLAGPWMDLTNIHSPYSTSVLAHLTMDLYRVHNTLPPQYGFVSVTLDNYDPLSAWVDQPINAYFTVHNMSAVAHSGFVKGSAAWGAFSSDSFPVNNLAPGASVSGTLALRNTSPLMFTPWSLDSTGQFTRPSDWPPYQPPGEYEVEIDYYDNQTPAIPYTDSGPIEIYPTCGSSVLPDFINQPTIDLSYYKDDDRCSDSWDALQGLFSGNCGDDGWYSTSNFRLGADGFAFTPTGYSQRIRVRWSVSAAGWWPDAAGHGGSIANIEIIAGGHAFQIPNSVIQDHFYGFIPIRGTIDLVFLPDAYGVYFLSGFTDPPPVYDDPKDGSYYISWVADSQSGGCSDAYQITVVGNCGTAMATTFRSCYKPPPQISFQGPTSNLVPGQKGTLTWTVTGCDPPCQIKLQGAGVNKSNLPTSGTMDVIPLYSSPCNGLEVMNNPYTLSATGANGSAKPVTVYVTVCSDPPPSPCSYVYLKMVSSLDCFTLAVCASSTSDAIAKATATYPDYTASVITYGEFLDGCQ